MFVDATYKLLELSDFLFIYFLSKMDMDKAALFLLLEESRLSHTGFHIGFFLWGGHICKLIGYGRCF